MVLQKLLGQFDFGNESEHSEDSKKDATSSQLYVICMLFSKAVTCFSYFFKSCATVFLRPVVSDSINSSIFHQLAEHLQQQNLEQFQKQLMEHQQHQQKVLKIVIFFFFSLLNVLEL